MKNSLITRFAIVGVVLVAWFASLFPLHDREFEEAFIEMAAPQVEQVRKAKAETAAALEKVQQELKPLEEALAAIEDEDSDAYTAKKKEVDLKKAAVDTAQTAANNAALAADDYQTLIDKSRALRKEAEEADKELAQYVSIKEATKSDGTRPSIKLNQYIKVPMQAKPSNNLVLSYIRSKCAGKLRKGIDLSGGTEFVVGFDEEEVPEGEESWMIRDQVIEILRNRLDSLGLVEPEIKPIGDTSISILMPSVNEDSKAEVRRSIKATAKLRFRLVHEQNQAEVANLRKDPAAYKPPLGYEIEEMDVERDGNLQTEILLLMRRPEPIKGEDVTHARATFNELGVYSISLGFNSRGTKAFAEVTKNNVNRRLAIELDGKVYSAPNIREAILGGRAEITGSFTREEAVRLAGVIASDSLPVSIRIDSEFGTDPTLGSDSVKTGVSAAVWGMVLVVVFMIVYYRVAGAIAILALASNILLVMGTLTLAGATITLPGIAGIVLTIGMAVDANVLIFERIREERRNGKSLGNAVQAGYGRAFWTIFDANLTTLITALILFRFGTGPIRGFAVTLSIGILASMFTALFMTRAVFDLLLYNAWIKKVSMMTILGETSYDFLSARKTAKILSGVLVLVALLTGLVRGNSGLSIDFTGGTAISFRVKAETKPDVATVRAAMDEMGYSNCRISYKYSATEEGRLLEVVLPGEWTTDKTELMDLDNMRKALAEKIDGAEFETAQTNSVGSLVGSQFKWRAILAAILAAGAIVLYVSFRFELAYGVASVVALIHDVLIAGGIYLACGRQMSLPVVAALLTIMGYSLNDTIVVFDRIRENLGLLKGRTYRDIINISINQTLSRTVLTSLTTLLVVLTLFLFGGGAINDFALVMLVGVVVGTYSSIFVASAIISTWHKHVSGHKDS